MSNWFEPISEQRPWSNAVFLGNWHPVSQVQEVCSPGLTAERLGTKGIAGASELATAMAAATQAQRLWEHESPARRAEVLRNAADLISAASSTFDWWLRRESGATQLKSRFETDGAAAEFLDASAIATAPMGEILSTAGDPRLSYARRRPHGVVGVITPWNSPLLLAARVVAPALALGNAVVLKPDAQTAVTGGALLAEVLSAAGLPPGVFHVLPGGAELGRALVVHPDIAKISFTGSTSAGRAVGAAAGELLRPASLELGGNNALIIRADADLEGAADAGSFGSFFHQGQICFTPGRHLVHEDRVDEYAELLTRRARGLRVGPTTDGANSIGPVINDRQLAGIRRVVDDTIAAGATLLAGGDNDGLFFSPTVLADVTVDMPAFTEEIFGPVAPITTFASDDEAVELANRTSYGLATGIFSRDHAAAMALANRVNTGIIHLNNQTVVRGGGAPVGGFGASGNGGGAGRFVNLDEWTRWQWLTSHSVPPAQPF